MNDTESFHFHHDKMSSFCRSLLALEGVHQKARNMYRKHHEGATNNMEGKCQQYQPSGLASRARPKNGVAPRTIEKKCRLITPSEPTSTARYALGEDDASHAANIWGGIHVPAWGFLWLFGLTKIPSGSPCSAEDDPWGPYRTNISSLLPTLHQSGCSTTNEQFLPKPLDGTFFQRHPFFSTMCVAWRVPLAVGTADHGIQKLVQKQSLENERVPLCRTCASIPLLLYTVTSCRTPAGMGAKASS